MRAWKINDNKHIVFPLCFNSSGVLYSVLYSAVLCAWSLRKLLIDYLQYETSVIFGKHNLLGEKGKTYVCLYEIIWISLMSRS